MNYENDNKNLEQENASEVENGESTSDLANSNEIVPEDPHPSRAISFAGPIKNATASASKGIIAFIKKNPYVLVISGILFFIFFIAVIFFQLDYDLYGVGDVKPEYRPQTCSNILLTWENEKYQHDENTYKVITDPDEVDLEEKDEKGNFRWLTEDYDYDTYVTNIVWTDNVNANIIDNNIVYQAMSVAARSYLVASLPDNCVVLRDYNHQSFTKLDGTEEHYQEISQAVKDTKGIIIGRNNEIIAAKYDIFTYFKKLQDQEEGSEAKYFYHMINRNEDRYQVVPADWVIEIEEEKGIEIPKNKTLTTNESETIYLESMGLYTAKYLLERVDSGNQYDLYRILETFYGRDIEYYTIQYSSGNENPLANGCYYWPIGSREITIEDGVTLAIGEPETIKITSYFGPRKQPKPGASTYHKAIDIGGGVEGVTNIIASEDGVVTNVITGCTAGVSSCGGKLGNAVYINHGDGIMTRYGHMYSVSVNKGDTVKKGQVIGKMGNTGNSTGTHLDFQVIDNSIPVNPLNYVSPTNPRPTNCGYMPEPPGPDTPNKSYVCQVFLNAGFSASQVAGILLNADRESGYNPLALNSSSGAYGLFQWLGGRKNNLKSLMDNDKINVQVFFALSELNSSENKAKIELLNTNNPEDASYSFCFYYERWGTNDTEKQNNCNTRRSGANVYYNYVMNGCKD